MLTIKVGIQLASLRQPFKKALHTAARLGADAVEINARSEIRPRELTQTGIRQLRKMLEDLNLRVCAVGFRTRRGYNVIDDLEQRIEATRQAMRFAYDLGGPVLINHVGRIPDEPEGPEWSMLIESLSDLGQFGQRCGVQLAAETGSEDGAVLARLIDALPDGSLAVNLDPGNLIIHGFSAADATRLLAAHVVHVHAKDGVRDLAQGRGLEVPLGRGSAEFPELLGILEEQHYRGYFTVEREHPQNALLEVEQAVSFLRSL